MNRPVRMFYMPRIFEVEDRDTLRLKPLEKLKYNDLTKAYWIADCDLTLEEAALCLNTTTAKLRLLVSKIDGFSINDNKMIHERILHEFRRAQKASAGAKKAAGARWNKGKRRGGSIDEVSYI